MIERPKHEGQVFSHQTAQKEWGRKLARINLRLEKIREILDKINFISNHMPWLDEEDSNTLKLLKTCTEKSYESCMVQSETLKEFIWFLPSAKDPDQLSESINSTFNVLVSSYHALAKNKNQLARISEKSHANFLKNKIGQLKELLDDLLHLTEMITNDNYHNLDLLHKERYNTFRKKFPAILEFLSNLRYEKVIEKINNFEKNIEFLLPECKCFLMKIQHLNWQKMDCEPSDLTSFYGDIIKRFNYICDPCLEDVAKWDSWSYAETETDSAEEQPDVALIHNQQTCSLNDKNHHASLNNHPGIHNQPTCSLNETNDNALSIKLDDMENGNKSTKKKKKGISSKLKNIVKEIIPEFSLLKNKSKEEYLEFINSDNEKHLESSTHKDNSKGKKPEFSIFADNGKGKNPETATRKLKRNSSGFFSASSGNGYCLAESRIDENSSDSHSPQKF